MKQFNATVLFCITATLISKHVNAQDGVLDPTFDTDGKVINVIAPFQDELQSVTVQPDGKIISAGYYNDWMTGVDFLVTRHNSNGTPDNSFDGDGYISTDFGGIYDMAEAIMIQPDGKILVGGVTDVNGNPDFAIARYNTDGSPDASFGTGGKVIADIGGTTQNDWSYDMALQTDGKIILVGSSFNGSDDDLAVARFKTDGVIDSTFNGTGIKVIDFGSYDAATGITIDADGKILVAGWSGDFSSSDFVVVRLNTDGTPDNTFDTDGKTTIDIDASADEARDIITLPDGKILVAGMASISFVVYFSVVRLNDNGSPDLTFNGTGKLVVDAGPGGNDNAQKMVLQEDGKVVISGTVSGGSDNFAMVRLDGDALDLTFDGDGKVLTDFGTDSDDKAFGMCLQPDGKLIVVGTSEMHIALARYTNAACGLEATVSVSGGTMTCDQSAFSYQWLDCDNGYSVIPGANAASFNPTVSGNYAVAIETGSCADTSDCYAVTVCTLTATATVTGFTVTCDQAADSYQWLDCANSYAEIAGATNALFAPATDGQYAVVIEENGCMDTSACYTISGLGMAAGESRMEMAIVPNPATDHTTIFLSDFHENVAVKLINLNGELVGDLGYISGNQFTVDLNQIPAGVYWIAINVDDAIQYAKVVKM